MKFKKGDLIKWRNFVYGEIIVYCKSYENNILNLKSSSNKWSLNLEQYNSIYRMKIIKSNLKINKILYD